MEINFLTILLLGLAICISNAYAIDDNSYSDLYEYSEDKDGNILEDGQEYDTIITNDDQDLQDELPDASDLDDDDADASPAPRLKRNTFLTGSAIDRSLTRNPVGKPEFRGPTLSNKHFNNLKNFGARVGGSAGVKAWESGRQSVGVGVSGQVNTGLRNGRPYVNKPAVGAGLGYKNGGFSAGIGKSRGNTETRLGYQNGGFNAGLTKSGKQISGSLGYQKGRFSVGVDGSRKHIQASVGYRFKRGIPHF